MYITKLFCSEISGIKELSAFRFKSKKEGRSDKRLLTGVGLNITRGLADFDLCVYSIS